jgi:hypothetical protein
VLDLLGLVACNELLAVDRMAADARLAPDLNRRALLYEMAAARVANYRRLVARLVELGAEPEEVASCLDLLRPYHESTAPKDWFEALTRACIGDAVTDDVLREIAGLVEEPDRQVVLDALHERRYAELAAAEIRAAVATDPVLASRLSMWARRLAGEALAQAARVGTGRPALNWLITERTGDPAGVRSLFTRLTAAHVDRMSAVGLNT